MESFIFQTISRFDECSLLFLSTREAKKKKQANIFSNGQCKADREIQRETGNKHQQRPSIKVCRNTNNLLNQTQTHEMNLLMVTHPLGPSMTAALL